MTATRPHIKIQIALFSMPRFISGTNFLFYFVMNQFHLFMFLNRSFFSPLSPSITPSLYKLKTYLLGKSFLPNSNIYPEAVSPPSGLPLTSNRHHLSYDDCLENKGRLQDCSCSIGSYHCIQCYAHIL